MASPYNIHNIIMILLRTGTSGAEQSSSSFIRRGEESNLHGEWP